MPKKSIDGINPDDITQDEVVSLLDGATISPLEIFSQRLTASRIAYFLAENNFLNPGSGLLFNQTLSNPSIEINSDFNGDGITNQTYSVFVSEVDDGLFAIYDKTNGSSVLEHNPGTGITSIPGELVVSSDVSLDGETTFLSNAPNLNTGSNIIMNSDQNSPEMKITAALDGGGTRAVSFVVSETSGDFFIQNTGSTTRNFIQYDNSTTTIFINEMLEVSAQGTLLRPTVMPTIDQNVRLGTPSRRFLDIYSFLSNSSGTNPQVISVASNGEFIRSGSDERLKKDIIDIPTNWSNFNLLKPRMFKFKTTEELAASGMTQKSAGDGTQQFCGFIAQEIELASYNDCTITSDYDGIKSVDPWGIIAVAVKHIQDLEARLNTVEGIISI